MLLVAHCLQGRCGRFLGREAQGCALCGGCDFAAIRGLSDRYGVRFRVAGGGREAAALVREDGVRAVVAVACHRELVAGIWAAFPKPVFALFNTQPNGYCHFTRVEVGRVERALRQVLGLEGG